MINNMYSGSFVFGILLTIFLSSSTPLCTSALAVEKMSHPPEQLDLNLRMYAENLQVIDGPRLHAMVTSARLVYQSEYYGSDVSFGFDVGGYGAVKILGDSNSRNMVHLRPDGSGFEDMGWAYIGESALKMKVGDTVIKYGLQPGLDNPYLPPYDIRSLPPTFRGLSVISSDVKGYTISAGSFDQVIPRGDDQMRDLSTSYGGIPFERISYIGTDMNIGKTDVSFYGSLSDNLWHQYYFSAARKITLGDDASFTGRVHSYLTQDTGSQLAGEVDNQAVALSLTAQLGASSLMLGYQAIGGDQFFDYTQETAGIYLSNSMGMDYNSPNEKSVQIRYTFKGDKVGIPGFKLMIWWVKSHGVDGSNGAAAHSDLNDPLYSLYWKSGEYVRGSRYEWGIKPSYEIKEGNFKGTKIAFYVYRTRVSPLYPSSSFDDVQLMIDIPIEII